MDCSPPREPNLLFILTDEQRPDTMACYGNTAIETPNMNALAQRSVVFDHAYCTQPVCTPSRGSLLSGLYPHGHGAIANNTFLAESASTLAERMPDSYRCGYVGKWHLGDEVIAQRGFDHWISIDDNYRRLYSRPEYQQITSDYHQYLIGQGYTPDRQGPHGPMFTRPFAARLPEAHTKAAFVGREASRFLEESKDQPFALYVNFLEPHMPFTGPFDEMYDPDSLRVGPAFFRWPPEDAAQRNHRLAERYRQHGYEGLDLTQESNWRILRARYFGLVTLVDRALGPIFQALEATGQADNTIVVFTSDHGDMMGDHRMLAKGVLNESSVRVPLLLRVPWLSETPRRVRPPISQIDLVPTLLDLLGLPLRDRLHGRSLLGAIGGQPSLDDNHVVIEWNSSTRYPDEYGIVSAPWRSIVSPDRWKMNLCNDDRGELYDLNTDPHEMCNTFNQPGRSQRKRELYGRLRSWQKSTGDDAGLPSLEEIS